jgi:hypothetical protein
MTNTIHHCEGQKLKLCKGALKPQACGLKLAKFWNLQGLPPLNLVVDY